MSEAQPARFRLSDDLNNPVRLSLFATVQKFGEIDFQELRDVLQVSDSVLSKHVSSLEKSGFLRVRKEFLGKRPRTWISAPESGKYAFQQHVNALKDLLEGH